MLFPVEFWPQSHKRQVKSKPNVVKDDTTPKKLNKKAKKNDTTACHIYIYIIYIYIVCFQVRTITFDHILFGFNLPFMTLWTKRHRK